MRAKAPRMLRLIVGKDRHMLESVQEILLLHGEAVLQGGDIVVSAGVPWVRMAPLHQGQIIDPYPCKLEIGLRLGRGVCPDKGREELHQKQQGQDQG